jgi:hypothetical protein
MSLRLLQLQYRHRATSHKPGQVLGKSAGTPTSRAPAFTVNAGAPTSREEAERKPVANLLDELSALSAIDVEQAIFRAYDHLDRWLTAGMFDKCDAALAAARLRRLDAEVCLTFLTATALVADRLPSRSAMVEAARARMVAAGMDRAEVDDILSRLA